ncbi:MAG TPA: hypothetical protein PK466_14585 [Thermotogota bacterium]|nr:hypothetical protein [Thermotogota bacterium]
MNSTELKNTFDYFDEVYSNKEKYNIAWAFKDAQGKINNIMKTSSENCRRSCCSKFENALKKGENLTSFQKFSIKAAKRTKWFSRLFENLHIILTVVEIFLSVILVIVLSNISHSTGAQLESEMMGTIVVVLFAFFKVFLERWFVKPAFDEWGWRLYRTSTRNLYNFIVETINTAEIEDAGEFETALNPDEMEILNANEMETVIVR